MPVTDESDGGTTEVRRRAHEAGHAVGVDVRRDPATRAGAITSGADRLGIHPQVLRTWVRPWCALSARGSTIPEVLRTWVRQVEVDAGDARPATLTTGHESKPVPDDDLHEKSGRFTP